MTDQKRDGNSFCLTLSREEIKSDANSTFALLEVSTQWKQRLEKNTPNNLKPD